MKISLVTTVLNEEKSVIYFLSSVLHQSKRPDEIIIVDGGSKDNTVKVMKKWISEVRSEKFKKSFKVILKKGNRSIGRNEGIGRARGEVILSSDFGCILDKNWVKNIAKPFKDSKTDLVAGYYKGLPKNVFEQCLIPYVLVMPDNVNPNTFLPSARSMAFKKSVWKNVGKFPEQLSSNEDYVFARKLRKDNQKIVFRKNAIVYWFPRKNIFEAFLIFFGFAMGDVEAGILRPKVALLLARYIFGLWILIYSLYISLYFMLQLILYILIAYILWSILKNYRYVKNKAAFIFLPLIQITADIAVISGTAFGFIKGIWDTRDKL